MAAYKKYKVGDYVTILSKYLNRADSEYDYPFTFTSPMLEECGGKRLKIVRINENPPNIDYQKDRKYYKEDSTCYYLEGNTYMWHASMFEDSEKTVPDYVQQLYKHIFFTSNDTGYILAYDIFGKERKSTFRAITRGTRYWLAASLGRNDTLLTGYGVTREELIMHSDAINSGSFPESAPENFASTLRALDELISKNQLKSFEERCGARGEDALPSAITSAKPFKLKRKRRVILNFTL